MKTIVLRFNDNNAPEEGMIYHHNQIINKYGYVWYGKFGNRISDENIKALNNLDNNEKKFLFVRNGMKDVYWAFFDEISRTIEEEKTVPKYYRDEINNISSWFKIKKIEKVDADILDKCSVISSQKKLSEAIRHSMNPCFVIEI